jgi:hypothetical protein
MIPTILLSAAYPSADLEAQLAPRNIPGMSKPFHSDLLLQLINRTLDITPPEDHS